MGLEVAVSATALKHCPQTQLQAQAGWQQQLFIPASVPVRMLSTAGHKYLLGKACV